MTKAAGKTDSPGADVPEYTVEHWIPSEPGRARPIHEEVERALRANHFTDRDIFGVKLALEEALVNAIAHGNGRDPNKRVRVAYRVTPERFDVLVADEGPGFDPDGVPDCTAPENLERPCGRGVMLMRHYMNAVRFNASGNTVFMTRLRNSGR